MVGTILLTVSLVWLLGTLVCMTLALNDRSLGSGAIGILIFSPLWPWLVFMMVKGYLEYAPTLRKQKREHRDYLNSPQYEIDRARFEITEREFREWKKQDLQSRGVCHVCEGDKSWYAYSKTIPGELERVICPNCSEEN